MTRAFALLAASTCLLYVTGCSATSNDSACLAARASLEKRVQSSAAAPVDQASLTAAVSEVRSVCEVSDFATGMVLLSAYRRLGDKQAAVDAVRSIAPANAKEEAFVEFRSTELYTLYKDQTAAEGALARLAQIDGSEQMLRIANVEYQCQFSRCALMLDELRELVRSHPDVLGYRVLLAFSLADRHEFAEAAKEYDFVFSRDPFAMDPRAYVIATAAYVNIGELEKARRIYAFYLKDSDPARDGDQLRKMEHMILTPGQTFLFSKWPIEEAEEK